MYDMYDRRIPAYDRCPIYSNLTLNPIADTSVSRTATIFLGNTGLIYDIVYLRLRRYRFEGLNDLWSFLY